MVTSVHFSPDDKYVFTTSRGGQVAGATFQWLILRHEEAVMMQAQLDSLEMKVSSRS
jgi:hypothetical protein